MTRCFVFCNCQKTIFIRSDEDKEKVFRILHMLRIHTGLRKLGKKMYMTFIFKKMNPFEIGKPCINIERREMLFEKYRMAIKRGNMMLRFKIMIQ